LSVRELAMKRSRRVAVLTVRHLRRRFDAEEIA